MKEIISSDSMEKMGVQYDDEEVESILFSLKLYTAQIRLGNIPADNLSKDKVTEALEDLDEIIEDFEKGPNTVLPNTGTIVSSIVLPFTVKMYDGLSVQDYDEACRFLNVKPFDLFKNAYTARQIIEGQRTEIEFVNWV
jgi:hypothetical protein